MAYLNKGKILPMSVVNNMRVDEIPPELAHLTVMEQRLVSKVQAFMKLIVLPLGQRALAGQTINFPIDVSEVCNTLPRPVNSDDIILVKPPDSRTASLVSAPCNAPPPACFPVNKNHVRDALVWLKALYRDVVIDMNTLPKDTPSTSVAVDGSSPVRRVGYNDGFHPAQCGSPKPWSRAYPERQAYKPV